MVTRYLAPTYPHSDSAQQHFFHFSFCFIFTETWGRYWVESIVTILKTNKLTQSRVTPWVVPRSSPNSASAKSIQPVPSPQSQISLLVFMLDFPGCSPIPTEQRSHTTLSCVPKHTLHCDHETTCCSCHISPLPWLPPSCVLW